MIDGVVVPHQIQTEPTNKLKILIKVKQRRGRQVES